MSHQCGVGAAIGVAEGKWKAWVIWVLAERPRRFGETRRLVSGISEKVLTQQLRELEADGIVHREVYDELPLRVEYSLTPKGRRLHELLELLDAWGLDHLAERSSPGTAPEAVSVSVSVSDGGGGAPRPDSASAGR
ncbi:helix-turn-helix domain-containing protein [Streptomyces sp. TRM 70361]|uniref:winged helix-turn-helix transcriptional regulator n=1 Tax=Streptomyces sp. TRM 70361 TaxID=3116553 RepID=UPI002E7AC8A0|nr:helix-turn-helix domain-containing protein [Streptomyces sp. TRM 70361]MEE1939707.1 helix-turn-helix domain-containing protein [Streptomyces sp. TRM 70361]